MYSAVYKCVCKHQAERLYADLMKHVEGVVKEWSSKLEELRQKGDIVAFSLEFHRIISQFFTALSSIVPIFIYLVCMLIQKIDFISCCFLARDLGLNLLSVLLTP